MAAAQRIHFVHGWGLGPAVWQPLLAALPAWIQPNVIALPGYGDATHAHFPTDIGALSQALCKHSTAPAVWLGWSLGGMAVLELAVRHPTLVRALIVVGTNPSFIKRHGWPHALKPPQLTDITERVEQDSAAALRYFASLAALQGNGSRATARMLMACLQQPAPSVPAALRAGLQILRNTDLRLSIRAVGCPIMVIAGTEDVLVPPAAAQAMRALNPNVTVRTIAGAGHAPFVSHRAEFVAALIGFLRPDG
jgi:pimeloyl-[acyl-carrier protein] methyl ester esterase